MLIPSEVDGTEEEGSPVVPPHGQPPLSAHARPCRQPLVSHPRHGHGRSAQGRVYRPVRLCLSSMAPNNPGNYDQELFLALRDWEPFFTSAMDDEDDDDPQRPAAWKSLPC